MNDYTNNQDKDTIKLKRSNSFGGGDSQIKD